MKFLVSAILALSVLAAWPAAAQRHGYQGYRGGGRIDVQAQPQQRPGGYQRQPQQRPPQRDFQQFNPPPDYRRHDGRLTDDERRSLHRDLDRANREIYKGRR